MKPKSAFLIVNPGSGQNLSKLAELVTVFSVAGWTVDSAIKEYRGHTMKLAKDAAESRYDLVVGYGGDGTLNQVVNGVMAARNNRAVVGVIPGGTANVWAHELGIPEDPLEAALLLIHSEGREVDLGHVDTPERNHFLLMAGLGLDAAVLRRVPKPLKEQIGTAAIALTAVKELPAQRAFPIEIHSAAAGDAASLLWKGEALQVIVGNTRSYANVVEVTPDAYINDGVLDVCVITAGGPLTTVQQILALLFHRKHGSVHSEYFHGAHFSIRVPASVELQCDGSRLKRKERLSPEDRRALEHAARPASTMITYRFDAIPRALRAAIPCTYNEALFQHGQHATAGA